MSLNCSISSGGSGRTPRGPCPRSVPTTAPSCRPVAGWRGSRRSRVGSERTSSSRGSVSIGSDTPRNDAIAIHDEPVLTGRPVLLATTRSHPVVEVAEDDHRERGGRRSAPRGRPRPGRCRCSDCSPYMRCTWTAGPIGSSARTASPCLITSTSGSWSSQSCSVLHPGSSGESAGRNGKLDKRPPGQSRTSRALRARGRPRRRPGSSPPQPTEMTGRPWTDAGKAGSGPPVSGSDACGLAVCAAAVSWAGFDGPVEAGGDP